MTNAPPSSTSAPSRRLQWLEDHRGGLALAVIALALCLFAIPLVWMLRRNNVSEAEYQALKGLARQSYEQGDFRRAVEIDKELADRLPPKLAVQQRMDMAKALQQRGAYAEAESAYRAILDGDDPPALALLNLGLCLHRLGRKGEAAICYQQIIDEQADLDESTVERARRALALLEEAHVAP